MPQVHHTKHLGGNSTSTFQPITHIPSSTRKVCAISYRGYFEIDNMKKNK